LVGGNSLFLYILYFVIIKLDATIKNRSVEVGAFAMVTTAIQMYGYGAGMVYSIWKRLTMKKQDDLNWAETYRG